MKSIFPILFISIHSFGQSFKSDWANFSAENWDIEFSIKKEPDFYLKKETQGKIVFRNRKDKSIQLTYYVYLQSDMDKIFRKRILNWIMVQSCMTYSGFFNFDYQDYYYLLKPCHRCYILENQECAKLSDELSSFMLRKK